MPTTGVSFGEKTAAMCGILTVLASSTSSSLIRLFRTGSTTFRNMQRELEGRQPFRALILRRTRIFSCVARNTSGFCLPLAASSRHKTMRAACTPTRSIIRVNGAEGSGFPMIIIGSETRRAIRARAISNLCCDQYQSTPAAALPRFEGQPAIKE